MTTASHSKHRLNLWEKIAVGLVMLALPWALAALLMDLRKAWAKGAAALAYIGAVTALFLWPLGGAARLAAWAILNAVVMAWWLNLRPQPDQPWAPEFARCPSAERVGHMVTLRNVRNFSYRTEKDLTVNWETRTVDLSKIEGADLFLTHWGIPFVAHSIVSFRFSDGSYLATSIEARRTLNQDFSALRGFFRQFQVIYLICDERDVVRVRTNYRKAEDVYLYRTRLKPADARALFEAYLSWINAANAKPGWYNAVTTNCSRPITAYLAAAKIGGVSRWDWRGVLDGSGDKMLYQLGNLKGDDMPFDALKRQAHINSAAKEADASADFSQKIRAGRAGF
jgi:hypothetical protein